MRIPQIPEEKECRRCTCGDSHKKRKYPKLAFYLDDRYLSSEDSQFVELVQADLENFWQAQELDRVLLFPPVNNYLRLLFHKTVESYPPLHSFSVGEGAGRQTVVCWKQAVISADLEYQSMSATRPPSSRGRGRGILRDYHSQSPAARSGEELSHRRSPIDDARGKSQGQDTVVANTERKEKRERKARRPDVQVYVPRGRRLQGQQNTSPQNKDRAAYTAIRQSDDTVKDSQKPEQREHRYSRSPHQNDMAEDSQKSELRGHRYSRSPQQRVRPGHQGPAKVATAALGNILKGQKNDPKQDNRSQRVRSIDNDLIGTEHVTTVKQEANIIANSLVPKCEEIADDNKNNIETGNVSIMDTPVRDDASETQTLCLSNRTNDRIYSENDHNMLSNENVSEQEENETLEHNTSNKTCEDGENESTLYSVRGGDNERCIKKMKISETSGQNVNYNSDNSSNLSDDAKICHILKTETDSIEMNTELNTALKSNSDSSHEYCTNGHDAISSEVVAYDSDVLKKDTEGLGELMQSQNIGLFSDVFESDKVEVKNTSEGDISCQIEQLVSETEQDNDLNSDSKPISDEANLLAIHNSCKVEEGCNQSSSKSEESTGETVAADQRQITVDNLCDNEHNELQILENVKKFDNISCETDRLPSGPNVSDVAEVLKPEIGDTSLASNLKSDNLSIEKALNEHSCDKQDSLTFHETETEVLRESNIKVSDDNSSISETEGAARDEVLNPVEDSEKQEEVIMEIDSTQARDVSSSSDNANLYNVQEEGQLDHVDCRQATTDISDRNVEILCHPIMSEDLQKPQMDMTAKKVIIDITSDQSENHPDTTVDQSQSGGDQSDEESWDTMFDDNGDCLDPAAMEELTRTVGKVKIQKSKKINYLDYKPKDKSSELDYTEYGHIIEIYDFPAEFVTRDLIMAFQAFMSRGFDLKWVDDTHALGVFSSSIAAQDALNIMHPLLKVCPLSQASPQAKAKARRCTEFLQPYKPRPETSAVAARRLVAGALGLQSKVPKEKRDKERQQLKEAKAKRRQDRQNRDDIWEGRLGKCAMDDEG